MEQDSHEIFVLSVDTCSCLATNSLNTPCGSSRLNSRATVLTLLHRNTAWFLIEALSGRSTKHHALRSSACERCQRRGFHGWRTAVAGLGPSYSQSPSIPCQIRFPAQEECIAWLPK